MVQRKQFAIFYSASLL